MICSRGMSMLLIAYMEILVESNGCRLWALIIINKKYHIVSFNTKCDSY